MLGHPIRRLRIYYAYPAELGQSYASGKAGLSWTEVGDADVEDADFDEGGDEGGSAFLRMPERLAGE